jgi:hypothetical protein
VVAATAVVTVVATAAVHSVSVAGNLLPTLTKIPRFNQRGIFYVQPDLFFTNRKLSQVLAEERRSKPIPAEA